MVKSESKVLMVEREIFPATTLVVLDLLDLFVDSHLIGLQRHFKLLIFKVRKTQVVVVGRLVHLYLTCLFQMFDRFYKKLASVISPVLLAISDAAFSNTQLELHLESLSFVIVQ